MTSITVIVAMLVLAPSGMAYAFCIRRCPVCGCLLLQRGKHRPERGNRA